MKQVILKNWMTAVLISGACFGFVACDDNDDENTPPITPNVTVVEGQYNGTMAVVEDISQAEGREPVGTDLAATVSGDVILFSDFPIRDLVVKIVGEENADAIIAKIGKVDYAIPYTAVLSEDKASVTMTLNPEPLKLTLSEPESQEGEAAPIEIEVVISAAKEGAYTIESQKLGFNLAVESVSLDNTVQEEVEPFSLGFDLIKK